MTRYFALIPAAGTGARFGASTPKQYLRANGRPLLWHALAILAAGPPIERAFVVLHPEDRLFAQQPWDEMSDRIEPVQVGGATRAESVLNGLRTLRERIGTDDWVLVHDAARPCLRQEWVDRLIAELGSDEVGGLLAVPVADTLKRAGVASPRVAATVPRAGLWRAQTPQMFRYGLLVRALERADSTTTTDEASAVEQLGLMPRLVMGSELNIKVTYPEELRLAELILGGIAK